MLENEEEVNPSEIWYMGVGWGDGLRMEGKEQPGSSAPDGRLRRKGLCTQALPHRNDKVREDEQLADEEDGWISLETETADKRGPERMSLGLTGDHCR